MDWYYAIKGKCFGPVTRTEMIALQQAKTINTRTLVWCDGMADWSRWGKIGDTYPDQGDYPIPRLPDASRTKGEFKWFYAAKGAVEGPYNNSQFSALYIFGKVTKQTPVWCDGLLDWMAMADVAELKSFYEDDPTSPPPLAEEPEKPAANSAIWLYAADGEEFGPFTLEDLSYRLLTGEIGGSTLVFHAGMPAWTALKDVPELAPIYSEEPEADEDAPFKNLAPENISTAAPFSHQPAGPFTRFFARCFDSSLFALAFAGLYLAQLELASAFGIAAPHQNTDILTLLIFTSFLATLAIHFAVLTLSGNSIGKTLFGIRLVTDFYERFTLWGHIKREMRVLVFGLGLYIPVVQQVLMALAFLRVARGRPTGYDRLRAHVLNDDTGPLRRFFGIGFTLIVMLIALVAVGLLGTLMPADALLETPD